MTIATASRTRAARCACGRPIVAGGECAECRARRARTAMLSRTVSRGLAGPGRTLDTHVRTRMERAFGRDFSRVRVHSDGNAGASARALQARAYTVGSDIVLGAQAPQARTPAGRELLAHELAHVAQQPAAANAPLTLGRPNDPAEREAAGAARAVANGSQPGPLTTQTPGVVRRDPQRGTSTFEEHVESWSTDSSAPGITTGTVRREEYGDQHRLLGSSHVNVRWDANACRVTVPVKVAYREPTAADLGQCPIDAGQHPRGFTGGRGREIFNKYVETANERLNGWFTLRLDGCAGAPCADRTIPIDVEVREDSAAPDYTVAAVDASGRSCVSWSNHAVVLIGSPGHWTLAHEAGHMALGHGDEYAEGGRPVERVREDDFSLLADQSQRWTVLHERHFAFVPAFMKKVLPGSVPSTCRPRLETISRPLVDFRLEFGEGWWYGTRASSVYFSGGADIGLRTTGRDWRFSAGPRLTLAPSGPLRQSYLLGVRLGAEHYLSYHGVKFPVGAHVEGGGVFGGGPYVEGGVRAGVDSPPLGPVVFKAFVDAAAGTTLDPHDPENQHWFRLGIGIGASF